MNTNYENHHFPGNNDLIMDNLSDHDVSLLSLLNSQINESSDISAPSDNPSQDHHHVTYSKISSPLKLNHIPESEESEEESQINSNTQITSVHDAINEVLNQSTIEGISELEISEDPEIIIHEDTFEQSEGRKESLLDPINRLKELMNSQPPLPDHLDPLESDSENHSSQESLSVEHSATLAPVSVSSETDNKSIDISDHTPVLEVLSIKFRKRRITPEALISDDIKQIMSRTQRINTYAKKLDSLKQEITGLQKWININIGREPPLTVKNYKKGSHQTISTLASSTSSKIYSNPKSTSSQPSLSSISRIITESSTDNSFATLSSIGSNKSGSSRSSLDLAIQASSLRGRPMSPPLSPRTKTSNFLNLNRHNSFSKSSRPPIFMPPAVMNDPSANSPTSPTFSTPIKPRQRRLSFQAVTSRFGLGSSTPTSTSFPTTIEEKNVPLSNPNSVVVDEVALNKLCDVLPHADREVLSKYLRAAGGKDDLMAVNLYMRDLRNGEIT